MKAPRYLTESFRDGVDERESAAYMDEGEVQCWLAQFDKAQRPCEGRFERFHFISRQRVEHALGALLPELLCPSCGGAGEILGSGLQYYEEAESCESCVGGEWSTREVVDLAVWDCRNGGIACEAHHRRFDSHLVPLPSEKLVVPYSVLPEHVLEFASDFGLEDELEAKFESPAIEGAVG